VSCFLIRSLSVLFASVLVAEFLHRLPITTVLPFQHKTKKNNNLVSRLRHRNKVLLTYLLTNLVSFAVKGIVHRVCLRVTGFVTLQTSLILNKFI